MGVDGEAGQSRAARGHQSLARALHLARFVQRVRGAHARGRAARADRRRRRRRRGAAAGRSSARTQTQSALRREMRALGRALTAVALVGRCGTAGTTVHGMDDCDPYPPGCSYAQDYGAEVVGCPQREVHEGSLCKAECKDGCHVSHGKDGTLYGCSEMLRTFTWVTQDAGGNLVCDEDAKQCPGEGGGLPAHAEIQDADCPRDSGQVCAAECKAGFSAGTSQGGAHALYRCDPDDLVWKPTVQPGLQRVPECGCTVPPPLLSGHSSHASYVSGCTHSVDATCTARCDPGYGGGTLGYACTDGGDSGGV